MLFEAILRAKMKKNLFFSKKEVKTYCKICNFSVQYNVNMSRTTFAGTKI